MAAAFFLAVPDADLVVSRLFGTPSAGFPMADLATWAILRNVMLTLANGSMLIAVAMLASGLVWPRLRLLPSRIPLFWLSAYLVGPGLIANGILKRSSGRPRPRDIFDFGGSASFTKAFDFGGTCTGNCSFVSGEASALATVATLMILCVVPRLAPHLRSRATGLIVAVTAAGSLLRVAFGAHFLSDVVFANLICVASTLLLYIAFGLDRFADPSPSLVRGPAPVSQPVCMKS